jgi:hypothetical protein
VTAAAASGAVPRRRRMPESALRTSSECVGESCPAAAWAWAIADTRRVSDAGLCETP